MPFSKSVSVWSMRLASKYSDYCLQVAQLYRVCLFDDIGRFRINLGALAPIIQVQLTDCITKLLRFEV